MQFPLLPTLLLALSTLGLTAPSEPLTGRDTVPTAEQPLYDTFVSTIGPDNYYGYFYNSTHVWLKIHDADTQAVTSEKTFTNNGKAMTYLLQDPSVNKEDVTPEGVVGAEGLVEREEEKKCKRMSGEDLFVKRAARCGQFCSRSFSCTVQARCPTCRYVGGNCRHQLSCQPR